MWKSSIQRTFIPGPIKSAPDPAPPTNSFIPRPLPRPIPRSTISSRKVLEGYVFWAQRRHSEPAEGFFPRLGRIRDLGGITTNNHSDPSITHYIIALIPSYEKEVFSMNEVMGEYKAHQVIREHAKWLNPSTRDFDQERNKLENRTRMVVRRGWLEDVIAGTLRLTEEGKWGVYLRSELDAKAGSKLHLRENDTGVRTGKDPRIRTSDHSYAQDVAYFATPPPSSTSLHAEVESAIIKAPTRPIYRERSSPEDDLWAPSSYIVTPPSATISLPHPDLAAGPTKSTSGPVRQMDFYPPRNHLKYTASIHPTVQPTGLFTPPPSASPPPVMRSPEYIMIPKSHFASEAYVWQPPSEEEVADTPKYEDLPSPVNEDVASPSYSPIPTLSDPGTPPPIGLEVTVETPVVEKNEGTMVSVNTQVAEASIRPPASRQASFGMKRPRPRSPVGIMADDRPLAKRQSLPCMPSRSTSRSESPLSPAPDEPDQDMLEEDEDGEEDGHFMNGYGEGSEDEVNGRKGDFAIGQEEEEEVEEEDYERFPSPSPSPSPSISHHSDFDSGCEIGCQPVEFDEEADVSSTCKISDLISKSVDEIDLKTFDLGKLVLECDFTDELTGLLEAWI